MGKSLVVVESPTKARTIGRYLGKDMQVLASMGHVRDLPPSSLGVDVRHGFKPQYVLTRNGKKVVGGLKEAAAKADRIFLATDPDREGEAIAWHIYELLRKSTKGTFRRVTFHEITPSAIRHSFENPSDIEDNKVSAQQARRVLDRLVGYQVSPMLWRDIRKGTSAGRVQSVALRLVCEREREILGFEPVEYWNLDALFETSAPEARLLTRLALLDGKKPQIGSAEDANLHAGELEQASYKVSKVKTTPRRQSASPPFITSTLQQAAGASLRFSTRRTMSVAQELYEGVELGAGGPAGLITYMRTDSVSISAEARDSAREFIERTYGREYVPAKPNVYRSGRAAQEAHEAIRPTDVSRTPDSVAPFLSPAQLRLYRLIWQRFVASQMAPARQLEDVIEIEAAGPALTHDYVFRATARRTIFPGYQTVYNVREADQDEDGEQGKQLPELREGVPCDLVELKKEQCFTTPPRRFSEATLVKALEQNGVGRPSTYSATVNTIQERDYVTKDSGRLVPTELGFSVNDYLVQRMPELFDVGFTAAMEGELDKIEEGDAEWTAMLKEFYEKFRGWVHVRDSVAAPHAKEASALLAVFPDDIAWDEPVKKGRRVYDDGKFFDSLKKQVTEQDKALSERQWKALLMLAARYSDRIPELDSVAADLGLAEIIEEFRTAAAEKGPQEAREPNPEDLAMLDLLNDVEWEAPSSRGKRVYDDGKFHRSLRDQVLAGNRLSPAQTEACKRLILKYRERVADFAAVAERFGITPREEEAPSESPEVLAKLLAAVDGISEWDPPKKRGRRTFDDREFGESLRSQFTRRGSLSVRQVEALKKMLVRYAPRIEGYEALAAECGLGAAAEPPKPLDVACPTCGKPLVRRSARGREFFGCSAFPKCRFASARLPGDE